MVHEVALTEGLQEENEDAGELSVFRRWFVFSNGGVKATTISLMTATLGPGMLAYPDAVQRSGLAWAGIQFLVIILLSFASIYCLVIASSRIKKFTYGDMAEVTLGKKYKYLAEFFFFCNNFGSIISYLVLINQNIHSVIGVYNSKYEPLPAIFSSITSLFWVSLATVLLIPIVLKRNLKDLKIISMLGLATILYLAFTIALNLLNRDLFDWNKNMDQLVWFKFGGVSVSSSEMLYSFQCQQYVMLAYHELTKASPRRMRKVVLRMIVLCSAIYLVVGLCGYISFADKNISSYKNLFMAYDLNRNLPISIGMLALTITLVCSLPYCLRPSKESLYLFLSGYLSKPSDSSSRFSPAQTKKNDQVEIETDPSSRHHIWLSLLTLSMAFSVAAVCISFNLSLNALMTIVSVFTSPPMCFIFPFLFCLYSKPNETSIGLASMKTTYLLWTGVITATMYWISSVFDVLLQLAAGTLG